MACCSLQLELRPEGRPTNKRRLEAEDPRQQQVVGRGGSERSESGWTNHGGQHRMLKWGGDISRRYSALFVVRCSFIGTKTTVLYIDHHLTIGINEERVGGWSFTTLPCSAFFQNFDPR